MRVYFEGITTTYGHISGGIVGCLISFGFLYFGITRAPLEFNPLNPVKKPLSVMAARLIYIPVALLFLVLSLRDILSAVR